MSAPDFSPGISILSLHRPHSYTMLACRFVPVSGESLLSCDGNSFLAFGFTSMGLDRAQKGILEGSRNALPAEHRSGTHDWHSRCIFVSLVSWPFHYHKWPCYRVPGCRCGFRALTVNVIDCVPFSAADEWQHSVGVDSLFYRRSAPRAAARSSLLRFPLLGDSRCASLF